MSWFKKLSRRRFGLRILPRKRCPRGCGVNVRPAMRCCTSPIWERTCTSVRSAVTTTASTRQRLDLLLDPEGRFEIGFEVVPVDSLKFKDNKRYVDRLEAARKDTGETDALVVVQGSVKTVPVESPPHSSSIFSAGPTGIGRG